MNSVGKSAAPPDALHEPLLQLQAITAQLSATLPQEHILRKAFLLRYIIPGISEGAVALLDRGGQISTSLTTWGDKGIQDLVPPGFLSYLNQAILRRRQPLLIESVADHPGLASFWPPERLQEVDTLWAIPLLEGTEKVLGFMFFLFDQPFRPSPEVNTTALLFASHLVATLRQAQLFEEVRKKSEQEERLRILGEVLHRASSLTEILRVAPGSIARALGLECCTILLKEEDKPYFSERGGVPSADTMPPYLPLRSSLAQRVMDGDEVTVIADGNREGVNDPYIKQRGLRSFVAAPLRLEGEVRAVVLAGAPFPCSVSLETVGLFRLVLAQLGSELSRVFAHQRTVQEREKFEAVFQSVSDGIALFDTEGNIAACNAAMLSLLGWHGRNVIGLHYSRAFTRHDELARLVERIASGEPLAYQEGTIKRPNGRVINIGLSGAPISSPGKLRYAMLMVRDISQNKEIDRIKSEFISTVSHDPYGR